MKNLIELFILLASIALIGIGCWLISPALSSIVVGSIFFVLVIAFKLPLFFRGKK